MTEINAIKTLSNILPRHSLLTIYMSFVRSHLNYADMEYDQPTMTTFPRKLKECSIKLLLP